jgi:hypothetical protein
MNEEQLKWVLDNGEIVQEYGFWSIRFKGTLVPGLTIKDLIDIIDCERPHE